MDPYDDEFYDDPYDSGESLTITCSQCREEIYEDAVSCPSCGEYVTRRTSFLADLPLWKKVLFILIIGFLILCFVWI